MFFKIGAALTVTTQYLHLRGKTYQFRIRVPRHLVRHYGKPDIRKSLNTTDLKTAMRLAEAEAQRCQAEFSLLTSGKPITPKDVATTARELAQKYNLETFIDHVIDPARERFAQGDEWVYENAPPSDYLSPVQLEVLQELTNPDTFRLSDALGLYLKLHRRGADPSFSSKTSRDWNRLVKLVGDIHFDKLSRSHARDFVDHLLEKGQKTGTVRRTINTLGVITRTVITELEVTRTDPFKSLKIPGEGLDASQPKTAQNDKLQEIAKALAPDSTSAVALMLIIQMELGTRIGEVSGLGVEDVYLNHEIPHIHIRNRPWRTVKTKESDRRVPLTGLALKAVQHALTLPRSGEGLFDAYAKPRGNDNASAAANKRLAPWGLTSHALRHTMKDRFREAGCPKDVRDAIMGHSSGDVAETYGQGHSLRTMLQWLDKVAITL